MVDLKKGSSDSLERYMYYKNLQPVSTIGLKKEIELEYFRLPKKIDIDKNGNVYILNRDQNTINVYDSNGRYIGNIGKWGRGPGEFENIITFDFDENHKNLFVLDETKVEVFSKIDNNYEYSRRLYHSLIEVFDLCVLGDELFISGFSYSKAKDDSARNFDSRADQIKALNSIRVSKPISKFRIDSLIYDSSFGFEYQSVTGYGPWTGKLSRTKIECNEFSQTIVGVPEFYPFIFGYNKNGILKWSSKIENFRPTETLETITPEKYSLLTEYVNENVFDRYYSFREINEKNFTLIQVGELFPQGNDRKSYMSIPERNENYKNLIVDTKTGKINYSSSKTIFLGARSGDQILSIFFDSNEEKYLFRINEYKSHE